MHVKVYIGNHAAGGVCTGGTSVNCASTYTLVDDQRYTLYYPSTQIPFTMSELALPAYYSTPGDGKFQAFYVFAEPENGSLKCNVNNYSTEEHN